MTVFDWILIVLSVLSCVALLWVRSYDRRDVLEVDLSPKIEGGIRGRGLEEETPQPLEPLTASASSDESQRRIIIRLGVTEMFSSNCEKRGQL